MTTYQELFTQAVLEEVKNNVVTDFLFIGKKITQTIHNVLKVLKRTFMPVIKNTLEV